MNSVAMIVNAVTGPAKAPTPVTPELVERVEARLRAARTKMLFHGNWAFFAYLAMHLKPLAVPGLGTCATDGEFFLYDPVVLDAETVEWLEFDWGHEVLHLFGMDLSRKPADDVMIVLCANCGDGKPCPKGPCPEFSLWNFCCFPAGTVVPGDYKPIEDLKPGDGVFGKSGLQKVVRTFKRPYKGKLHRIRASGLLPFEATDEHPVLVAERKRGMPVKLGAATWKKASEIISKKDYLAVPILKAAFGMKTIDIEKYINRTETNNHDQAHNVKKAVLGGVALDADFAWIMGLWCAEGSLTTHDFNGIQFSLHAKEVEFADRIGAFADKYGYCHSRHIDGNCLSVRVTSRIFAKLFSDLMGRGAANKVMPEIVLLHEDLSLVRAFLDGLFAGDGCQARKNEIVLGTISKRLALQVQQAIARFGQYANVCVTHKPAGRVLRGRTLPEETIYSVRWITPKVVIRNLAGGPVKSHKERWKVRGEFIFVPVTEVSSREYDGDVYNIETEDHTYTVSNAVVHNCDLFNNLKLEEEGFQVPPFVPIDRALKGMSKDEIYAKYRKNVKNVKKGKGRGQGPHDGTGLGLPKGRICGGCKKHKNGKTDNFKPSKDLENLWKQRAKEAVEAARMKGKSPGFAESAIAKLLASRQDWRSILWQFCTRCEHEWRYRPPSRTGAARNVVLPRLCPEDAIEHGVLIIDTSGSISDENLAEFGGEMMAICNSIRMRVTVIMCDAAVQEVYEFEPGEFDWRALKFAGRGGTDFRPPFIKIEKLGVKPTFAIYFTDLCGTFPDAAPEYPVLWANVAPGARPPWGQYISLRDETV